MKKPSDRDMTHVEMWNPWKRLFFNGLHVEADSTAWKRWFFNGLRWRTTCSLWPTAGLRRERIFEEVL